MGSIPSTADEQAILVGNAVVEVDAGSARTTVVTLAVGPEVFGGLPILFAN